jgi:WD40 repeat protein
MILVFVQLLFLTGCSRPRPTFIVTSLAFSHDGELLAAGGSQFNQFDPGCVHVWNTSDWTERATLKNGYSTTVRAVAFSPDDRLLATGTGVATTQGAITHVHGEVHLWTVDNWTQSGVLKGNDCFINNIFFDPNNRQLITCDRNGFLKAWNAPDYATEMLPQHLANCKVCLSGEESPRIAYSSSGSSFAYIEEDFNTFQVRDTKNGSVLHSCRSQDIIITITFAPEGKTISTCSENGMIRQWDVETGRESSSWEAHADRVTCLLYSPDGEYLISGCTDGTVRVWDARNPGNPMISQFSVPSVTALAIAPSGKFLAIGSGMAGRPPEITVWRVPDGTRVTCLMSENGENSSRH